MASLRDLLVGAVLSGAVTFGTTYYVGEREHQRRMEEQSRQLTQAQQQVADQARQSRTAELYQLWSGQTYAEKRNVLSDALARRSNESIGTWDTSPSASAADSEAMRDVLRFYGEMGIELRAGRLDEDLVRGLFGPNVEWWNVRVLPSLCRGYSLDGVNDRFNNALLTFEEISGRAAENCPSFVSAVNQSGPRPLPAAPRPMPSRMSPPD